MKIWFSEQLSGRSYVANLRNISHPGLQLHSLARLRLRYPDEPLDQARRTFLLVDPRDPPDRPQRHLSEIEENTYVGITLIRIINENLVFRTTIW